MNHLQWSTGRVLVSERPQVWSHINNRYFGRLRVGCLDEGPLDASLEAYEVGPLRMFRIEAPAHEVVRDASCGELPTDDFYKLVLQVRGRGAVEQFHERVLLQPGNWALYDPRAPYRIANFERCTLLVTQVPREMLAGLRLPRLHAGEAGCSNAAGLHGVFGTYLRALSEQLPGLPDGVGRAISESVLGLLGSTLAEAQRRQGEPLPLPAVLKLRVRQYVQAHLSDPDLSIQRIADTLRCSKRYLHRVFEDEPLSLERQIWISRLEHCRDALMADGNTHRSAAEIGFAWGFKSGAHFCRLFKLHFGLTPGACQRQAIEARQRVMAQ
ncbi:MAG: helix-turn-helix domain-containing protein [Burkholderiales bacterium]|nr:helix-turn-helix domain-containing protein [Burkholderiales bacterium]